MAFFDKLNNFASAAGEKASGAIEVGKLNLKQSAEDKKIEVATFQIGASLLLSLDAGQEYDETIMALYDDIKASRAAITSIRAEIASITGSILCSTCGAKNASDSKFCCECGSKLNVEPPEEVVLDIVETVCPSCGASVDPTEHFCTQCGHQLN